jgi:hypothetical protein
VQPQFLEFPSIIRRKIHRIVFSWFRLGADGRTLPYETIIELTIFLYGAEFAMKKALDFCSS